MPIWKFLTLEEAETHLDRLPWTPESSLGSALALLELAEGVRTGVRTTPRGIVRYHDIAHAEAERERFAVESLRRGDAPSREGVNPSAPVWLRRCDGFEEESQADRAFWSSLPPERRVAVIDELRRQWLTMQGAPDEGLRRVVRVLEPPRR